MSASSCYYLSEKPATPRSPATDDRPSTRAAGWSSASSSRISAAACVAMALAFGITSYRIALSKSPTFDEPMEAVAAWEHLRRGDHRMSPENPPLWMYWAALANGAAALHPDHESPDWRGMPHTAYAFADRALYKTPGVDATAFVNRSRAMMVSLGVALAFAIGLWAWRLGGPIAACVAVALYSADPNFLAYAALVKNDVTLALAATVATYLLWRVGLELSVRNAVALAVACALVPNVKLSGVFFLAAVAVLLAVRAALMVPWAASGGPRITVRERTRAAFLLLGGCVVALLLVTWACYGFRYTPSADPGVKFDALAMARQAARAGQLLAEQEGVSAGGGIGVSSRLVLWAMDRHLLPQPFLFGLLAAQAQGIARQAFLDGERRLGGWWYYFPLALLYKTPLATLASIVFAAMAAAMLARNAATHRPERLWAATCLVVPPIISLAALMLSHMDIGVRHALVLYPFAFIGVGWVTAACVRRWKRGVLILSAALVALLAIETASVAPHLLAFFNAAAGGPAGGARHLGDSNLDWGQDLPLLADWQRAHPDVTLYLSYSGMVDPARYGLRYAPLPGNYLFGPEPVSNVSDPNGVVAVGTTTLQGLFLPEGAHRFFAPLRSAHPIAILGGTIYLYEARLLAGPTAAAQ